MIIIMIIIMIILIIIIIIIIIICCYILYIICIDIIIIIIIITLAYLSNAALVCFMRFSLCQGPPQFATLFATFEESVCLTKKIVLKGNTSEMQEHEFKQEMGMSAFVRQVVLDKWPPPDFQPIFRAAALPLTAALWQLPCGHFPTRDVETNQETNV